MIIIFDLDYTIYKTDALVTKMAKELGISRQVFFQTDKERFGKRGENFSVSKFVDFLSHKGYIDKKEKAQKKKIIKQIISKGSDFVLPEAKKIMKELRSEGHKIILLTYGDKQYQKEKIEGAKIKEYFSKIIYTDKDKAESLKFLQNDNSLIVVVNDNAKENVLIEKNLKNSGKKAKIFLVKGKHNNNAKHLYKTVTIKQLSEKMKVNFENKAGNARSIKIIAKFDGKEVGRAFLFVMKNDIHSRPFGFIEDVYVDENYRGQKIGSELVQRLIAEAKKKKCYKIIMTSRYSRDKVHSLYKKIGFKDWGKEFRMDL